MCQPLQPFDRLVVEMFVGSNSSTLDIVCCLILWLDLFFFIIHIVSIFYSSFCLHGPPKELAVYPGYNSSNKLNSLNRATHRVVSVKCLIKVFQFSNRLKAAHGRK